MQIDYHGIYSCPVGQVIRGVGIELKLKCNFGGIFEPDNSPVCEDQGICSKLRRSCNNTVLIGYCDPCVKQLLTQNNVTKFSDIMTHGLASIIELNAIQGYCEDGGHPEQPAGSHLVKPADGRVTEYKYKSYECESGYRYGRSQLANMVNRLRDSRVHATLD